MALLFRMDREMNVHRTTDGHGDREFVRKCSLSISFHQLLSTRGECYESPHGGCETSNSKMIDVKLDWDRGVGDAARDD